MKKRFLDPNSSAWGDFKKKLQDLQNFDQISSKGSDESDELLEELLRRPGENQLNTNLGHTITEDFLSYYDGRFKVRHPGMTSSSGVSEEITPPWLHVWRKEDRMNARKLLLDMSDALGPRAEKSGAKGKERENLRQKIENATTNPQIQLSISHHIDILQTIFRLASTATEQYLQSETMFPGKKFFTTVNTWAKSQGLDAGGLFWVSLLTIHHLLICPTKLT